MANDPSDGTTTTTSDAAPLTIDEQAMLAELLARKAASDAVAARANALLQLDGVEDAIRLMMGSTALGVLRAAAAKTWDQDTLQRLNRIGAILDVDGPGLLATIADLRGDGTTPAPSTAAS